MPLTVRKFKAKVRDSQTGNMIPAGLLSSDALEAIEDAKDLALDEIDEQVDAATDAAAAAQESAQSAASAALNGNLAPQYSGTATYEIGDHVLQNGTLYRCNTTISSPQSTFVAAHWTQVKIGPQVDDIIKINQPADDGTKIRVVTSDEDVDLVTVEDLDNYAPLPEDDHDGTAGYVLRSNGDGSTEWAMAGTPTDTQTQNAVTAWMESHSGQYVIPDGNITEAKLSNELKLKTINDYVTPEMFGAVGDGVTDDVEAIEAAITTGKVILLTKKYKISRPINIVNNTRIYGDKIGKRYDQPIDTAVIISDGIFFHSDSKLSMIQLFDIALWDRTALNSENKVFDCRLNRSDFRINGYNIHTFSNGLQHCSFESCFFLSTKGSFTSWSSDTSFRNCYISGATTSENPFLTGTISALVVIGCYFDFWHYVFYPTDSTANNIISDNIFDACYRVFTGKYSYFGVVNNVFMRIFDSTLWSLSKNDWAVFSNGLRNYTRSIGNRVDANYYIHTSLTGSNYPNTGSYSGGNSLSPTTQIKWNPYPNDSTDLLNTRIEELNYKTYDSLQNAALTSGKSERFNYQIVNVNDELFINNNGNWKNITLSKEITLTFQAFTLAAHSTKVFSDNTTANAWRAARYYMTKPAFNLPTSLTYCAYCHTDKLFRIIVSNPTDDAVQIPAGTWKIRSFLQ